MHSLTWTQIEFGQTKPPERIFCTLTQATNSTIVLYGGLQLPLRQTKMGDTWIMDLQSKTWRQYKPPSELHHYYSHRATTGINSVIIIGGIVGKSDFHVMLEPKSLQLLASQILYEHRTELPWKHLPNKLVALLGLSETDKDTDSKSSSNNTSNRPRRKTRKIERLGY